VKRNFAATVAILMTLSSTPVWAAGGGKVAVLDVQTTGLDVALVTLLTEVLSAEVESLRFFDSVISGRDIATMMGFERQRDLLGCTDETCLAELGGALGVDRIVASHVGKLGKSYIVQIKLINIVDQKTERRIYEQVKADDDVLIETIRECVQKLVEAPEVSSSPGILPMLVTGLSVAALGSGIYIGLRAKDLEVQGLPENVGSQLYVGAAKSTALIANIAYGVSAATGALAVWLWVRDSDKPPAVVPHVGVAPSEGGTIVKVGGAF
jgi:hypothetical protein